MVKITQKQTNAIIEELGRSDIKICDFGGCEINPEYLNEVINNNISPIETEIKGLIGSIDFMLLYHCDNGYFWEESGCNGLISPMYEDILAALNDFDDMMEQRGYKIKLEVIHEATKS